MSELNDENYNIVEHVQSGEYFADARKWYNTKYLLPYVDRSLYATFAVLLFLILGGVLIAINNELPLVTQIKYSVNVSTADDNHADIHHLTGNSSTKDQIATILLTNYIVTRENYDYAHITEQMSFVKNNSSAAAFKEFYNYINLKNPQSPLLRYQKYGRRNIKINSVKILKNNRALVKFSSKATNFDGKQFEDLKWQVLVGYQQGPLNIKNNNNEDYQFVITNYKLKLLK